MRKQDGQSSRRFDSPRRDEMKTPDDVSAMVRLKGLGWGAKRIATELGCSKNTVKRWLQYGDWRPCVTPSRSSAPRAACSPATSRWTAFASAIARSSTPSRRSWPTGRRPSSARSSTTTPCRSTGWPGDGRELPVDSGGRSGDNARAHERRDPDDREDDEGGFPARDPVPDLGARPEGARQKSLSRNPGRLFYLPEQRRLPWRRRPVRPHRCRSIAIVRSRRSRCRIARGRPA